MASGNEEMSSKKETGHQPESSQDGNSLMGIRNGKDSSHVPVHFPEYKCLVCNLMFPNIRGLNGHMNNAHNKTNKSRPTLEKIPPVTMKKLKEKIKFSCMFCIRSFDSVWLVKRHIVNFHKLDVNSFYCNTCGKGFNCDLLLQDHNKTHLGKRR